MNKKLTKSKTDSVTKNCCDVMEHPDHSNLLPNINRIAGQIEGIKKMISDRRYCIDILQQLKSIKSAIGGIEAAMLEAHMDSCVTSVFLSSNKKERNKKISELKNLYRQV